MKKYKLTPEHEAQLKPWAQKWIANAMSTKPMDDEDRIATAEAIEGLYRAADLEPPPRHRIVFVASPLQAAVVAGHAAAVWAFRKEATDKPSSRGVTASIHDLVDAATYNATAAATEIQARGKTFNDIHTPIARTRVAPDEAIDSAAFGASPTSTLDLEKWYVWPSEAIYNGARRVLEEEGVPIEDGQKCSALAWRMRNGGNQYSAWVAFLSFFDRVVNLDLPIYEKWRHYESAAIHSGPRYMHEQFCVISDRPRRLLVDEQNRPHSAAGPFCQWSDGSALYSWHGIRVPALWIEKPNEVDPKLALTHENIELRTALAQILGWEKVLAFVKTKTISVEKDPTMQDTNVELLETDLKDGLGKRLFAKVIGPGAHGPRGQYVLEVTSFGHRTAIAAIAATYNKTEVEYAKINRRV